MILGRSLPDVIPNPKAPGGGAHGASGGAAANGANDAASKDPNSEPDATGGAGGPGGAGGSIFDSNIPSDSPMEGEGLD